MGEIKDIKPKYRLGDTFREKGVRGYIWWRVDEIENDKIWEELDGLLNSVGSNAWDYVVMGNKNFQNL